MIRWYIVAEAHHTYLQLMSELKHNIQECVSDIHERYDQNKLVINKSKYSVMLATTRQRILHIDNNNLDVRIGDYKLVQSY